MKKILALVLAMMLVLASVAALAAPAWVDETGYDTTFNSSTLDASISVSGLEENDAVKFIKILEFDADATAKVADATELKAGGWKVIDPFNNAVSGITVDEFKAMLTTGITETLAGKLATIGASAAVKYNATAGADGVATITDDATTTEVVEPEAGLYLALITPAKVGYLYNPVFVSADYYTTTGEDKSSTWAVDLDDSYAGKTMAKRQKLTLDKTAKDEKTNDENDEETVAVGDDVTFTVKTTIPEFANNYTKAVFNITDELSSGLKLDTTSIKVYKATVSGDTWTKTGDPIAQSADENKTYTIPEANLSDHGYKIVFDTAYLLAQIAPQPIIVEYVAKVTNEAVSTVNLDVNKVTLNYSNSPDDETGKGVLYDETKHYTFDIDANLLGNDAWDAYELVKVALDKDGNEIKDVSKYIHSDERTYGPLAGAEFELYLDNNGVPGDRYENTYYGANDVIVSRDDGRLEVKDSGKEGIRGLDAGVYWLKETKAPAGYIKQQSAVKIEIKTVIEPVEYTKSISGMEVSWKVDELKSYTIEIDGKETASYTFTNASNEVTHYGDVTDKATQGDTEISKGGNMITVNGPAAGLVGKIQNTQGVELPSTGGIGTTIFYVAGSILVLAAVIFMVTKRRMNANND